MKNYTITVNGNVYEVTVEEGAGAVPAARAAASVPAAAPKAAPSAAPKAAPSGAAGSVVIGAPMPGKILNVKAGVGQAVRKGDVVVVLEAMKMENEIVAPSDGTIASVNVSTGDSVVAGATLVTLN